MHSLHLGSREYTCPWGGTIYTQTSEVFWICYWPLISNCFTASTSLNRGIIWHALSFGCSNTTLLSCWSVLWTCGSCLLVPCDTPKSRQGHCILEHGFPFSPHTTSALACIQTCSLSSGVDYSSRQAPLSALGKKSTRIEMRGYGNLNSYGNRPAYIFWCTYLSIH